MPELVFARLTPRIWSMSPGKPDRPVLALVVGERMTLMLDAGASAAHARRFLDAARDAGLPVPRLLALTHWHWDHVFGAHALDLPTIAQRETAAQLAVQTGYTWDDAALADRVAAGLEIAFCAEAIRIELPEPRLVHIRPPDILFDSRLTVDLGGVTVELLHVGGDHSADSVVMHVPSERFVFLGDSLYDDIYAPTRHYTAAKLFPLLDRVLALDADLYVEGHTDAPLTRADLEALAASMRRIGALVEAHRDSDAVLAALGTHATDDERDLVTAFMGGLNTPPDTP